MPPKDSKSSANGDEEQRQQIEAQPSPPLVLITSPWLDAVTNRIRARPIPWEGYAKADFVSQDELKMIRSIEGRSDAEKLLEDRGKDYALLYLRLLTKLSRTDTLQQILVLVTDMLANRDDRLQLFFKAAQEVQNHNDSRDWPWTPLTKLLDVSDDFVQLKAAHIITLLLVAPTDSAATVTTTAPDKVLSRLLVFLRSLINSRVDPAPGAGALRQTRNPSDYAEGHGADIAIQLLESLLRTQQFRSRVWQDDLAQQSVVPERKQQNQKQSDDKENGRKDDDDGDKDKTNATSGGQRSGLIRGLVYILQNALVAPHGSSGSNNSSGSTSSASSTRSQSQPQQGSSSDNNGGSNPVPAQMQYEVVFCFWLLSFDDHIAAEINRKFGVVPVLVDIARSAVKEKVVRITVATLRNLLAKAPEANGPVMLGSKLLPLVEVLAERKFSDEEVTDDVGYLRTELAERLKGMSTYDEYLSELSSGKLSWDNPAHELDDFWKENGEKLLEPGKAGDAEDKPERKSSSSSKKKQRNGDSGQQEDNDDDDDDETEEDNDDGSALGRLISLLRNSRDVTTLAVAAHDVGKVVQFTGESGRRKINSTFPGAKVQIMKLMSHDDPEVKFRALNTVGKLVSASWR